MILQKSQSVHPFEDDFPLRNKEEGSVNGLIRRRKLKVWSVICPERLISVIIR